MKKDIHDLKLAVISGGLSTEREVCLMEGEEIYQILKINNLNVRRIIVNENLSSACTEILNEKFDFAFLALTEDVPIQDVLDMVHVAYSGSPRLATSISMDKVLTKQLVQSIGVLTSPYLCAREEQGVEHFIKDILKKLKFMASSIMMI